MAPVDVPILRVEKLAKSYVRAHRPRRPPVSIVALDEVDLELAAGSTLALVGRSGSGKSTLGRCLALLERPDHGRIRLDERDLTALGNGALRRFRRQVQLVFQDATAALAPRFSVAQALAEPLLVARRGDRRSRRRRVHDLLTEVGLATDCGERRVGELSGGQRRRLVLARALAAEPRILILDEALSGLDLPLRVQLVQLLRRLQARHSLTYMVISHDLRLVAHFADEIAVMEQGRVVERTTPLELLRSPRRPASRELVRAARLGGML